MSEFPKLLPCPFCGKKAGFYFIEDDDFEVECDYCDAKIDFQGSKHDVAERWNRRAK